jgi:hypothetical protein
MISTLRAAVLCAVLAGCPGPAPIPNPTPPPGTVTPIIIRDGYDYAPALIYEAGVYHLYWCAGVAGDYVLHSRASNPRGPWSMPYDVALKPTGSTADFDGIHTCDPNVIKVNGTFYLYYGGNYADPGSTAVGVAQSVDGVQFVRMNGGRPIFTAANPGSPNKYGAGQPAAFYIAPWFYLSITDTTGSGVNPGNGAGQFMLRALDPTFQSSLQEWTRGGWVDRAAGQHTGEFSWLESAGLDLALDGGKILAATNRNTGSTTLLTVNAETFVVEGSRDVPVPWREGPGLMVNADKTLLQPLTIVNATGPDASPWSWDISIVTP